MLNKKKQNGFSIIELTLVLAVLGVLFSFMLPKASSVLESARHVVLKSIVKSLQMSIESNFLNHGYYPAGKEIGVFQLVDVLKNEGIHIDLPHNPFTGKLYTDNDFSGKIIYSLEGMRYIIKAFGKNNTKEIIKLGN